MKSTIVKETKRLLKQAEKAGFPKGEFFRPIHKPGNCYLDNPNFNTNQQDSKND